GPDGGLPGAPGGEFGAGCPSARLAITAAPAAIRLRRENSLRISVHPQLGKAASASPYLLLCMALANPIPEYRQLQIGLHGATSPSITLRARACHAMGIPHGGQIGKSPRSIKLSDLFARRAIPRTMRERAHHIS